MNPVFALVIGSAQLLGYPSRTCTDAELLDVARQAQENAIRDCPLPASETEAWAQKKNWY